MEVQILENTKEMHYHDAKEHGILWSILNEMLHVVVLLFSAFGMIRFKVKFIHMNKLVCCYSWLVVIHSWYLVFKFSFISILEYIFSFYLEEKHSVANLAHFYCSANNSTKLKWLLETYANQSHLEVTESPLIVIQETVGRTVESEHPIFTFINWLISEDLWLFAARNFSAFGGPYQLLGKRCTLMYSFFALATLIMLAIFPLELVYHKIGFNYIRFVLNDTGCLRDLYRKRCVHVARAEALWAREDRSQDQRGFSSASVMNCASKWLYNQPAEFQDVRKMDSRSRLGLAEARHRIIRTLGRANKVYPPPPKPEPYSNRQQQQSCPPQNRCYNLEVAEKNMKKFKPYVRSEHWFKLSMIVYTSFIFIYFSTIATIIGAICYLFDKALIKQEEFCFKNFGNTEFLADKWSFYDHLTYYETHYMIFALGCASSFYCSYYFGTAIEILVWNLEVMQQMEVCKIMTKFLAPSLRLNHQPLVGMRHHETELKILCCMRDTEEEKLDYYTNSYGGIRTIWSYLKFRTLPRNKRDKHLELFAFKMLNAKRTILHSMCVNMALFLDELIETSFMMETILSRTTQLAVGFALFVGMTKSQWSQSSLMLTVLLGGAFLIMNCYLIFAASIGYHNNKLMRMSHYLLGTAIADDADQSVTNAFSRIINSYGEYQNYLSYKIFGNTLTWKKILNIDGAVCSSYVYSLRD